VARKFLKIHVRVSQAVLLMQPFFPCKITTDPLILAEVNIGCMDDSYPKLKIYLRTDFR
jgi:hypothetical protein